MNLQREIQICVVEVQDLGEVKKKAMGNLVKCIGH